MIEFVIAADSATDARASLDIGAAILRLVIGLFLAVHGINKFRGGISGTTQWFAGIGMRRPGLQARLAATGEIVAGVLLAIGLLTPVASAAVIGIMVVAIWTAHRSNGFFIFNPGQGWEYTATVALVAWAIAFIGPRRLSIDHLLGIDLGLWGGVAAGTIGFCAATVHLALFFRPSDR